MTTKRTLQYSRVILDPCHSVVSIVVVPATNQDLMVNETEDDGTFLEVMMRDRWRILSPCCDFCRFAGLLMSNHRFARETKTA
jgi:hypothetical protein